jgi:hypothetical protein
LADKQFATRVTAVAHTVRAFPTGDQAPALAALANRANAAITDLRVIEQEFAFPCHSLMISDWSVDHTLNVRRVFGNAMCFLLQNMLRLPEPASPSVTAITFWGVFDSGLEGVS